MSDEEQKPANTFLEGLETYLSSVEFQHDLAIEGSVAQGFARKLAVLVPIAQAFGERLSGWVRTEDFHRLAQSFAEADKWSKEAPQKLSEALATEGLIPHPLAFSMTSLRDLTDIFDVNGPRAAAEHLTAMHDAFICSPDFRKQAQERWAPRGRWKVFSQVLSAFDAGLYSVAIPPAIAQAEGIVAHLFGLKGMNVPTFKEKVAELHSEDFDLLGPLTGKVLNGLLDKFEHGAPSAKLNRHAVLHGADSSYGTRENAIAAIVWADYIMYAATEYKAIAIPKTGAEAAAIMSGADGRTQ